MMTVILRQMPAHCRLNARLHICRSTTHLNTYRYYTEKKLKSRKPEQKCLPYPGFF